MVVAAGTAPRHDLGRRTRNLRRVPATPEALSPSISAGSGADEQSFFVDGGTSWDENLTPETQRTRCPWQAQRKAS
jgi:hypothetical protein